MNLQRIQYLTLQPYFDFAQHFLSLCKLIHIGWLRRLLISSPLCSIAFQVLKIHSLWLIQADTKLCPLIGWHFIRSAVFSPPFFTFRHNFPHHLSRSSVLFGLPSSSSWSSIQHLSKFRACSVHRPTANDSCALSQTVALHFTSLFFQSQFQLTNDWIRLISFLTPTHRIQWFMIIDYT